MVKNPYDGNFSRNLVLFARTHLLHASVAIKYYLYKSILYAGQGSIAFGDSHLCLPGMCLRADF